jgi:hypothetical protein
MKVTIRFTIRLTTRFTIRFTTRFTMRLENKHWRRLLGLGTFALIHREIRKRNGSFYGYKTSA